ncbi:DUF397 domain-containing protein [Streptomyces sp. NPDC101062]|uniref:DUF397 domain-containing protein n=1 Tax=unclassified Streptomyces TaxID=2593676 RepID=UPI003805C1AD
MTHRTALQVAPEEAWFKSSYSNNEGGVCVEVAHLTPTAHVGIRDSKRKTGPALVVPAAAWAEFVTGARSGF